jgi:hypothetical protein
VKSRFSPLFLIIILIGTCAMWAQSTTEKDVLAELFKTGRTAYATLFDDAFLKQVSELKIREIVQLYMSKLGAYKSAIGSSGSYDLLFEKGKASCRIALTPAGRINTLWLGTWTLLDDNPEKLKTELLKVEGEVSVCITKNGKTVFAIAADKNLAVGSTFKLYVLKALNRRISGGKAKWSDTTALRNEYFSLPSGMLQDWPSGSPVTLHTLAVLMISRSDNTAADHLLSYLGRDTVEAVAPEGMKPFLFTNEMFKLKSVSGEDKCKAYISADLKTKRKILEQLKSIPVNESNFSTNPVLVKEIEWFASTRELCAVIFELKDLPVLSINPGLVKKTSWHIAGYKGGSEPGVLNYTHVLQKNVKSPIYAISATINNSEKNVDPSFTELVSRLIGLIERDGL